MSALSTSTTALSSFLSTSTSAVSVNGLVSGLDTSKVIQALLAIDQQKIDDMTAKESVIQSQQTAFKGVEAKLLTLQTQIDQLAKPRNGVFDARTVQISNPDALAAAASSSAVAGDYHLRINNLALANQIASQGFDRTTSSVTHGTFGIKIGSTTTNITIDASNDTLQGLADAINGSGAAVTAAIVNDGTGDDQQGYRLVLTSKATGTANRITITNGLANTGGGAVKPLLDANSISNAIVAEGNTSTAAIQANAGTGYTGTSNNVYQFTVVQGGTVGTDDGIQLAYSDTSGTHTGTITLNHDDVDTLKTAAQGVGVQFAAGTLVAGDTFTVKAYVPTVQAAADASVTVGSGAGALTVTNSSNQIDLLIPGVALSLKSADPTKDITVSVANDTASMTSAIQGFVGAYNDLVSFIHQQTNYDGNTKQAGPLLGNMQVIDIENKVRSAVQSLVPGADPALNYFGALGISTTDDGQLAINNSKLNDVLTGKRAGVTLDDVRKLFTLTGSSSNPGIQFVTAGAKTVTASSPYTVNVTQAAEQASIAGTNALAAGTVIDNTNNSFVISVDGTTSSTLTIAAGTYTRAALADAVQAAINGDTTLGGRDVAVGLQGSNLTITSNSYGAASRVVMQSGTALATLGIDPGASDQGVDVAGNFVVNGNTETAVGSGQFLLGNSGNTNTDGLQVLVSLTPAQVGGGAQASVTASRGFASQLSVILSGLFDSVNGRLKTIDDGFTSAIAQIEDNKAKATDSMNAKQAQLQEQFNAMEQTLAQLQSAGNMLAQQAASLNNQKK